MEKLFGKKIEYIDRVGCHPRLAYFQPVMDKNKILFVDGKYSSSKHNHRVSTRIIDKKRGQALISVELSRWSGYGFFGNGTSEAKYFCGIERGHWFSHRVASYVDTIDEAIKWLKPAEVQNAKIVKRQGDFYFVKQKKGNGNMKALLGTRHKAKKTEDGWEISHPQHRTLKLEGHTWKAVRQKQIGNGDVD